MIQEQYQHIMEQPFYIIWLLLSELALFAVNIAQY